jgi:hypothetical protein
VCVRARVCLRACYIYSGRSRYDTWLRVELFQHTGTTVADLEKQKRCGWVETTLRELYRTPIKQMPLDLRLSRSSVIKQGALELRIADAPRDTLQPFVEFSLAATLGGPIGKGGRTAKSTGGNRSAGTGEYFVTCHRYNHGGIFELFYRTERARPAGASVSFGAVKQSLQRCCYGRHDTFLRYELWQEDKLGVHQKLGSVDTTLAEMLEAQALKKVADKRDAKNDEEANVPTDKDDLRKEGRRRRRAATPGCGSDVSLVQYELKAPKTEENNGDEPKWVPGSMGALRLDEVAAEPLHCLMMHAELFSSTAPDEDATTASDSVPTGNSSGKARRKQKEDSQAQQAQLKRVAGVSAATASVEFGGDLDFLKELLDDAMVSESDVKDIVGDGIRFLHERHQRSSTTNGRSQKKSKPARGGAGYFLDGEKISSMKLKPPRSTKASQGHAMLLRLAAADEKTAAGSPQAGKPLRRRRPKSTPAGLQDGSPNHDASQAARPQTEGGGVRLPSIRTGGNLRLETRAAEAQQKHAQRRAKQAEADSRRSVKSGDREQFAKALRSDESTRTLTGQAVAALEEEERPARFMMQPPAPGVYQAPQQHSKNRGGGRGSQNGGRRPRGGAALAERSTNSATIDRLATPQKRATRVSEQQQQQRRRRSKPPGPGRAQDVRGARRAPVRDGERYVDDDDFGYSSEEDWESRALKGGGARVLDRLPSMRASVEAEEVEESLDERLG